LDVINYVVFDTEKNLIPFAGNYTVLEYSGKKNVHTATAGSFGLLTQENEEVFYAVTALRKGYLNNHGEWIVNISRFDSLNMDD